MLHEYVLDFRYVFSLETSVYPIGFYR